MWLWFMSKSFHIFIFISIFIQHDYCFDYQCIISVLSVLKCITIFMIIVVLIIVMIVMFLLLLYCYCLLLYQCFS
jgi:hypothetical protein